MRITTAYHLQYNGLDEAHPKKKFAWSSLGFNKGPCRLLNEIGENISYLTRQVLEAPNSTEDRST